MTTTSRPATNAANYNHPASPGVYPWSFEGAAGGRAVANFVPDLTYDLVLSGFGFASQIPAGAEVVGVAFQFAASDDRASAVDHRVVMRIGSGADSANLAKAAAWPYTSSTRLYGSIDADAWGLEAANPGKTLADIVRAADFAVAIQITTAAGDPEDFMYARVQSAVVSVAWTLPTTIAEGVMADGAGLAGQGHLASVRDTAFAGTATLVASAAPAVVTPAAFTGRADLAGDGVARVAKPAVTPGWLSVTLTDEGEPSTTITDTGLNQGGI